MSKTTETPDFEISELEPLKDWKEREGSKIFPRRTAADWFARTRRAELVKSGQFFIGTGQMPSMVGPGFGRVVLGILRREAAEREATAS